MKEGTLIGREGWSFDDDLEIQQVPIPSAMPKGFDSQSLPTHVKRSSAVEALIQQNDDLMSRLSVALRRISELEAESEAERVQTEEYKSRYENLRDQVLVLKEKTRILSERKEVEESDVQALKNRAQLMEIRYAELYQNTQAREAQLRTELNSLTAKERRQSKFLQKVRTIARGLRQNLKLSEEKSQSLTKRLAEHELTINALKKTATDSAEYIQTQSKEFKERTSELVKTYEGKLKTQETAINSLQGKLTQHEALLEKSIELENKLVITERRFDEYRLQKEADLSDLQKSAARFRAENKELALELESTKLKMSEIDEAKKILQTDCQALTEQVETLQLLWRDNQLKLEKSEDKNRALQKLNQELSQTINQYRKEIRELKTQADNQHLKDA
jgi:chromosome segregation ATPase